MLAKKSRDDLVDSPGRTDDNGVDDDQITVEGDDVSDLIRRPGRQRGCHTE